jgi:hypothetical protein
MENNEIMNIEEFGENEMIAESGKAGLSTGAAIGIGVGATLATFVGVKLVKNIVAYFKAKKQLQQMEQDDYVEEE